MAKTLFILNDAPYGTERSYNALRLAGALSKRQGEEVKLFLTEAELAEGTKRSAMDQLANWTQWADKTLVF